MKKDIEIAREARLAPVAEIAAKIGIGEDELELYGKYKAKISDQVFRRTAGQKDGRLVLVTAINPTPAGEGKTTTMIGLGQALWRLGKKAIIAIREPSMGPVFGIKGGAAGGGYAQVVPMEDINLHFTGDMHALTAANNLLSAMIDNHIHHGNELKIDLNKILWPRALDMNDRALRKIAVGLGGKANGAPRDDRFVITVASEMMAILCLAEDLKDLKARVSRIVAAYDIDGRPVTAGDLGAAGALTALLKDAIKPNLVQTLENTPVIMHGGPFANIAHGCSSLRATRLALKLGEIVITEAGFGADLGAEKFFDIKCRLGGLKPDAAVLVATIRSLRYNGGADKEKLSEQDLAAVGKGIVNLIKHIENLSKFKMPVIVSLNRFFSDSEEEIGLVKKTCEELGCSFAVSEVWEKGSVGGLELANKVIEAAESGRSAFAPLYDAGKSIEEKINVIAREIYGADGVDFSEEALAAIRKIEESGKDKLPVCMAKTQYSLSDNPLLLGRPSGFRISVREVMLSAGAGFVVALAGTIMTMPGLPKHPAALDIDIDENGIISGLF